MSQSKSSGLLLRLLASGVLALTAASLSAQTKNSCLDCHSVLPDKLGVTQETFSHDIHSQKGLTCVSCHGGNAANDDPTQAMSKKAGWKGHIDRRQVPALCGSCHSNPDYMRKFDPTLRTDQLAEYHTSVHGKLLASGDTKVAVCTDCHSVHNLRAPNDPQSTVYPVNIAATCSHCHADAKYMKGYSIPTDQFAKYNTSVHHDALTVRGDLSAPTCTTCHGNHGAVPPGVASVPNVCSTCHVFQAQMYEKSSHKAAFDSAHLPGCVVCHQNHAIVHPTDAKLSAQTGGVCMQCHKPGDKCDQARGQILVKLTQLDVAVKQADQALSAADAAGMDVSEARLGQNEARDSLTKARVAIHSFKPDVIGPYVQAGLNTAGKDLKAGQDAMVERDRRRHGLGFSLIAIGLMVVSLRLYINKIEK
ncbi:MAG TPA: cytochrome c3 family protein [Terracidiphilus sp.]|nr:cytochrome c3 family protein [Terracidiphilus sp.]